jgi:hypothetical protein
MIIFSTMAQKMMRFSYLLLAPAGMHVLFWFKFSHGCPEPVLVNVRVLAPEVAQKRRVRTEALAPGLGAIHATNHLAAAAAAAAAAAGSIRRDVDPGARGHLGHHGGGLYGVGL